MGRNSALALKCPFRDTFQSKKSEYKVFGVCLAKVAILNYLLHLRRSWKTPHPEASTIKENKSCF